MGICSPIFLLVLTWFILMFKFVNKVDIVLQYLSCRQLHSPDQIGMKGHSLRTHSHYLDISEYLLKEHSPYFRPKVPEHHQVIFIYSYLEILIFFQFLTMRFSKYAPLPFFQIIQVPSPRSLTPQLSPVIDGITSYIKTPLVRRGKEIGSSVLQIPDFEDFNDFSLQGSNLFKNQPKSKKIKKSSARPRLNSTWHFVDYDLEKIIEENDRNDEPCLDSSIDEDISEEENDEIMDSEDSDNISVGKEFELEKQSTTNFDLLLNQQPLYLEWHHTNPKKELLTKIKSVCSSQEFKSQQEKKQNLKLTIGNYIFDHERFYFEESMNQLSGSISSILATLTKGIDQTFKKTVGGLSFEKRRLKLVKYMEKKRRRVWRKKVNYDCRKKVADGRLRIKGKFVTYEQARQQLGMSSLEGYNADEIRNMIEKKNDS